MENTRKDTIVKGRYNIWEFKDFLFILIFIALLGIGVFLVTSADLQKFSYYPLGVSLIVLVYIILRIMFLGNFQVSRFNIVWKSAIGSIHTMGIDNIGSMELEYKHQGKASWLIKNLNNKKIKRFRSISPIPGAGAAILFFRYKDILPEVVFNIWKPLTKGKRTYEQVDYKLKIDGTLAYDAKGTIILYENKLIFIPTSTSNTLSEPEMNRVKKAGFSPEYVKYTSDENIKTHTLIEALLDSNLPQPIRDSYIHKIVFENGGNIFADIAKNGKQWQTYSEGVEIIITRS